MGVQGGAVILLDGAIFYLDPANDVTYPGTGTDVGDLVGTNHSTMSATGMFDSANFGTFAFDGTNDSISYGSGISSPTHFSWVIWFKPT